MRVSSHLCTALVHREAGFGRNFGAEFEHAKATMSKEECTATSHPRMMLRCAFLATALVGVVDFGAHFWPPLHGIGIPGSGFWTKFRSGF